MSSWSKATVEQLCVNICILLAHQPTPTCSEPPQLIFTWDTNGIQVQRYHKRILCFSLVWSSKNLQFLCRHSYCTQEFGFWNRFNRICKTKCLHINRHPEPRYTGIMLRFRVTQNGHILFDWVQVVKSQLFKTVHRFVDYWEHQGLCTVPWSCGFKDTTRCRIAMKRKKLFPTSPD